MSLDRFISISAVLLSALITLKLFSSLDLHFLVAIAIFIAGLYVLEILLHFTAAGVYIMMSKLSS